MPNVFSLSRISDPERTLCRFVDIDEELCAHFGVAPDPKTYYHRWYNFIGLGLSTGRTWDDMIAICTETGDSLMIDIISYLRERYSSDAWHEARR
jgi:hypothetical protein